MEEFELEPGEKITQSVRGHWIILFGYLFSSAVLAVLPLLIPPVFAIASHYNPQAATFVNKLAIQDASLFRFALAIWWLFVWMMAVAWFTTYQLTVWIITTTRIVDIRQYSFFSRKVSSFLLNRVQDVTTDVEGFLPTIFGFGSLNVETAGRDEKFEMRGIANPVELRDLIMREVAALHADGQLPQSGV